MARQPFPNRYGRALLPIAELFSAVGSSGATALNATGESQAMIGQPWLTSGPDTTKTLSAAGLGTEFAIAARDLGLKAGAGRLLYVYAFGFLIPGRRRGRPRAR